MLAVQGGGRPALGEDGVGRLLMLALLLDPVLVRVVLPLLLEFEPCLAAAADLLRSLLLVLKLGCPRALWRAWRGDERLPAFASVGNDGRVGGTGGGSRHALAGLQLLSVLGVQGRLRLPLKLLLVQGVGVGGGAAAWALVLLAEDDSSVMLLAGAWRGKRLERKTARAAKARLVRRPGLLTVRADHGHASTVLPLVEPCKIVLPVMVAHATYMASTVLQDVHSGSRGDLV